MTEVLKEMKHSDVAVLLVNTGTPSGTSVPEVKRYLKEFLGDPRIVEMPRALWLAILNCFVLPFRSPKSAERYKKIWTPEGSPLAVNAARLCQGIGAILEREGVELQVLPAQRYGSPSIPEQLDRLAARGVDKVLVLPLFPQYCPQTVGATMDAVAKYLLARRSPPAIRSVKRFYDRKGWAAAVAARVRELWAKEGAPKAGSGKLVISFHGIPEACVSVKGDTYRAECEASARLVADELGLSPELWEVAFQSKFGPAEWLQPYVSDRMKALGEAGLSRIDILCPSFTCDCLETCEEIEIDAKADFLKANPSGAFHYIPCINASDEALAFYAGLVREELQGWI